MFVQTASSSKEQDGVVWGVGAGPGSRIEPGSYQFTLLFEADTPQESEAAINPWLLPGASQPFSSPFFQDGWVKLRIDRFTISTPSATLCVYLD